MFDVVEIKVGLATAQTNQKKQKRVQGIITFKCNNTMQTFYKTASD
jgi:hypothetical protein